MLTTHAVGIDLGTTYSCISYLNEHGEPVTLANAEGELSTPSVVMFDANEVVVGTEALRNAIVHPDRVVQNSKRFMGRPQHNWTVDGKNYTPVDIAAMILKKLISSGQEQIGVIEEAVITVPAQFSDAQRHATIEAGHRAGLQRVDIINEPVAAALCYVLGSEGLWFTELADEQRIMVYDLGGGTFDLSMVSYKKNEVSVIASGGDLELGGIDWTNVLVDAIAARFRKEFQIDPRDDPESLQFLTLEAEQTKRSLTVRPRAALTCQHGGHRKTYQIDKSQFERLGKQLVGRTAEITKKLLKDNKMGWAHVDVVLTTGGSSRMPMIREKLKQMSGTTLNTTLSPDQSIAHGATYYAGMLLANKKFARSILNSEASKRLSQIKQQSVNARALGIMIRNMQTQKREPHYLVPPNTPLPVEQSHRFGTVVENQRRVRLQIIESGAGPDKPHVLLGECVVDGLPDQLPEGSEIEVEIRYDEQARVHVSAKDVTSGKLATAEILRQENLMPQLAADVGAEADLSLLQPVEQSRPTSKPAAGLEAKPKVRRAPKPKSVGSAKPQKKTAQPRRKPAAQKPRVKASTPPVPTPPPLVEPTKSAASKQQLEEAHQPIPLCNQCGEPLDVRGRCAVCGDSPSQQHSKSKSKSQPERAGRKAKVRRVASPPPPMDDDEILELGEEHVVRQKSAAPAQPKKRKAASGQDQSKSNRKRPRSASKPKTPSTKRPQDSGEDEFWKLVD